MYGNNRMRSLQLTVAGPCEFLVMYGKALFNVLVTSVAGPCEFLVMYGNVNDIYTYRPLQDPVNF